MINKINDICLRVLSIFTKICNKEYYIRELERLLKISSRTALLTLAELEKEHLRMKNKRQNKSSN